MKYSCYIILFTTLFFITHSFAADSVDVVFRYNFLKDTIPTVPGTFNGWNNSAWPMTKIAPGIWTRTARLAVGTYQYKFYVKTSTWPNDPLNHHIFPDGNQNSILYVKNPTIYQFLPNQRNPIVNTAMPTISAYLFPVVGTVVDTSALSIKIDTTLYTGIGTSYDFTSKMLAFTPPMPLANGNHTVILRAGLNADTVTFTTQGGFVQLLNQFPFTTRKNSWIVNGIVEDSLKSSLWIVRNHVDSFTVNVANRNFSSSIPLVEGENTLYAATDSAGTAKVSTPIVIYRKLNHTPTATISFGLAGSSIQLFSYMSSDPDPGQTDSLAMVWLSDPTNPQAIAGVDGQTIKNLTVNKPSVAGEYYFRLIASDPNGNRDTTRNYFTINKDGSATLPTSASNPAWARNARVYFLFPKAFTSVGTIPAATAKMDYIRDLGFNVIWLMPVMKNAYPIDNGIGPGYNITDFYSVAPEYGTNADLKNFVDEAHVRGIKVILDITPNHTSRFHPWSQNAHIYKRNSPYWNWYQHAYIPHNENGLGQSCDVDSFWYYSGFSDQLLNYNWTDVDAQAEMINVYKFWIQTCGVDGYRFDVYWGPHRRYGERYMGNAVRNALKHIKPDLLLLAEDDGTGSGTESIYADYASIDIRGGVDAAYDFKLYFNRIVNFGFSASAIDNLHSEIDNAGFYPGANALYMRFMESQDQDRIFYNDPTPTTYYNANSTIAFQKTMPMASVIFTVPGFPMLWNGQEVGWGYGISGSKIDRSRSVVNWDFQGKTLLTPHYQKLATIRGAIPAFTQHKRDTNHDGYVNSSDSSDFVRITSSNNIIYSFARPYQDQNGLAAVNFSGSEQTAILNLTTAYALKFSSGIQPSTMYYVNNLYANSYEQVLGSSLDSLTITLPAYGTGLYTVSLTRDSVIIDQPLVGVETIAEIPGSFNLAQNYPNPFNPSTTIMYDIPAHSHVVMKIYDLVGREVATLVDQEMSAGSYTVNWNAGNCASGVYFYRIVADKYSMIRKMMLLR